MNGITIQGTFYPLKFGMNFLREANREITSQDDLGVKQNIGLRYLIGGIIDGDVEDLQRCILMANHTEETKLTAEILDQYIEEEADIDQLFEEIKGFLSKANVTKKAYNQLMEIMKTVE